MEFLIPQNKEVAGEGKNPINATGKHVVVIGGGDTGSDCVGTSNRHGAASITQIEVMPRPPEHENKPLIWPNWPLKMRTSSSQEEGCERDWAVATKDFVGENGKLKALKCVRVELKDGKMDEMPGSEFEVKADLVFLAMGFVTRCSRCWRRSAWRRTPRGDAKAETSVPHHRAEGVCRGRHAPRPVAGGVGDTRRPPGGTRGG